MKIKLFSTNYMPEQEKYEKFAIFENELNQFIQSVKVIDIKYEDGDSAIMYVDYSKVVCVCLVKD